MKDFDYKNKEESRLAGIATLLAPYARRGRLFCFADAGKTSVPQTKLSGTTCFQLLNWCLKIEAIPTFSAPTEHL